MGGSSSVRLPAHMCRYGRLLDIEIRIDRDDDIFGLGDDLTNYVSCRGAGR
jgi:hypothetical protein